MLTCFPTLPQAWRAMQGTGMCSMHPGKSRWGKGTRFCESQVVIPSLLRETALGVVVKYHKYRGFPKRITKKTGVYGDQEMPIVEYFYFDFLKRRDIGDIAGDGIKSNRNSAIFTPLNLELSIDTRERDQTPRRFVLPITNRLFSFVGNVPSPTELLKYRRQALCRHRVRSSPEKVT